MTRRIFLWAVTLFLVVGCGSENDSFVSTSNSTGATTTATPALEIETVSGRVVLPSGSPLTLETLQISTPLGTTNPDASGAFTVDKFAGGSQLVLVLDPAGDPVLLGWLDEGAVVDINSTGSVLLFFALGAPHLPAELKVPVETLINELPEASPLSQTLAQLHVQNPKVLVIQDSGVQQALAQAVQSVIATQPLNRILSDPNPGESQSGVRLNVTESANQISLTNKFRRRAHAFIKRISYVDQQDNVIESPLLVTEVPLPPVGGITDLIGGLNDAGIVLLGYQEGNQLAYQEQTQDPIQLNTIDGSKITNFEVVVVGPGDLPGDLNRLNDIEVAKQQDVTVSFVIGDLALQMFFNILLPNSDTYQKKLEALLGAGADTVLGDLINTAKSLNPNIADKALQGDIVGALTGAYDLIINSGTFKAAVLSFFGEFFFNANETELFFDKARNVLKVTGAVDLALTTFDTGAIGKAIIDSQMANIWDLQVTPPNIVLRPQDPVIVQGDTQTFNVTVPEVDSEVPLVYKWSNTGSFGELTDGQPQHSNNFDSTLSSATYSAGNTSGQDTVTVEVFEVVEPGANGTRRSLGKASTTISVESIVITPPSTILGVDDSQEFTVTVPEAVRDNATFQWDLANDTGSLSSLTEPTITYMVGESVVAPASDTLTVTVMVGGEEFGSASASITISDVDIVVNPTSASLEPGDSESFSALAIGIPLGETAVYEWESVNGFGTVTPATGQNVSYIALENITPPLSDILRLRVFSENAQGNRTLVGVEDVSISIGEPLNAGPPFLISDRGTPLTSDSSIVGTQLITCWLSHRTDLPSQTFEARLTVSNLADPNANVPNSLFVANQNHWDNLFVNFPLDSGFVGVNEPSGGTLYPADINGTLGDPNLLQLRILNTASNSHQLFVSSFETSAGPDGFTTTREFRSFSLVSGLSDPFASHTWTELEAPRVSFENSLKANGDFLVHVGSRRNSAPQINLVGGIISLETGDLVTFDLGRGATPRIALSPNGGGIVVFARDSNILARTFTYNGDLGPEIQLSSGGVDSAPSVAVDLTNGEYVVVWDRYTRSVPIGPGVSASLGNVVHQRLTSTGVSVGRETVINVAESARLGNVAMDANGNCVITYVQTDAPYDGPGQLLGRLITKTP